MQTHARSRFSTGFLILTLMAAALPSCGKPEQQSGEQPPVRITAVIPQTGPLAHIGETEMIGIKLALEDAQSSGPPAITFHYEDSAGAGPAAVSAVQKRLSIDG